MQLALKFNKTGGKAKAGDENSIVQVTILKCKAFIWKDKSEYISGFLAGKILVRKKPEVYFTDLILNHFSNGIVWIEYLSNAQHLDAPLTDRALGGAQSEGLTPPGVVEQVEAQIVAAGSPLSTETLFAIWVGGNDFLNGSGDYQTTVSNIQDAMEQLAQNGAKHLLILYLPDLGEIPSEQGTSEAGQAAAFSTNFNSGLGSMLHAYSVDHADIALYEFDVYTPFKSIRSNPAAFGFVNATDPSPNFSVPNNFDGAGYVFWDDIHPTTQTHALIADQVNADINQQIQPATSSDGSSSGQNDSGSGCFVRSILFQSNLWASANAE